MESWRQEWHGKIDVYLNKWYEKNETYDHIIFSAITSVEGWDKKWSLLDLFNTKWLSKNNVSFLLSNMFSKLEKQTGTILFDRKKAECTKEWLQYINTLLNESVEYYRKYLLRNIWPSFIKKRSTSKSGETIELRSTKDIREFFTYSSNQKNPSANRQIHCSLLKIAYAINDIKTNEERISKAEKEFWEIKQNLFFNQFLDFKGKDASESIQNDETDFRYIKLQTRCEKSCKKSIFFNCAGRVKKKEQIIVKEISNPKYDSIDAINDIYGIRNEVKTKEDALFLLEYMRIHVMQKTGDIIYKNIFGNSLEESQRFVRQYASELDPDFYAKVFKSLTEKRETNKDYKDIKIVGDLWGNGCEIQINLVDNKNETGYAHHLIFDCKKKIRALSRLQGYIPYSIIHRYIREAIDKSINEAQKYWWYAELVSLGGYNWPINKITEEHKKNAESNIFHYLINIEQDVVKLNIPGANNNLNYYTSRSNWNYFHKEENFLSLYPQWAKARNTKKNERTNEII